MSVLNAAPGTFRVGYIGAEAFGDVETSWDLERGAFEMRQTLNDHSSEHPLTACLPVHVVENSPGYTYLTYLVAHVEGFGFSGSMPSAATLKLYERDGGTLLTVSDPSANTTALNGRHDIGGLLATPIWLSSEAKYLVQITHPLGGGGYGTWRVYGARFKFGQGTISAADGSIEVP